MSSLNAQDDELGAGLVLSPGRCPGLPSKRLQVRVSLLDTLDAAKRLTCGGVLRKLERFGWVLPQEGGPHMLVECVRGVEEPEPEPEPEPELTGEIILESVSGESGADSSPAPGEEKRESLTLGGFKLPPVPVFVFNPDLLHTVKSLSLALLSSSLSVANTPPPYTSSYTRPHAHPDVAHRADSRPTQVTQKNPTDPPSSGT